MKAFVALIIGVQIVVSVEYGQFGRVFERMLHIAEGVENAPERPHVDGVVNLTVVPCIEHFRRTVHRRRELSQLQHIDQSLIQLAESTFWCPPDLSR